MVKKFVFVGALFVALAAGLAAQTLMSIPALVRRARGAVVLVKGTSSDGRTIYQGTGFLVRPDGVVVTNYHVIANDASAVVKLPNGAFFQVKGVLAEDSRRDIAILKVQGTGLRTLDLGNSGDVQVGEEVVAIGNPLSLESTVSSGIISGLREDPSLGGRLLQITAPISHGSSGGPLFDLHGRVIGITTAYLSGGESLNFAIPIDDLKPLLRRVSAQAAPLPGGASQVEPASRRMGVPRETAAGGCAILGAEHTAEFCAGYTSGRTAGLIDGASAASTPLRPSGKPSLYVDATVSDDDSVGATFVYDLKSAIANSPLYALAPDKSAAAFDIEMVTVAPEDGTSTAGAVAIECGAKVVCATGYDINIFAFEAGSDAVEREAQRIMGGIDQTISALPPQQP
ncbi:MAG: S1C family serine protease [Terriglobales bacterium]